ncbi:MAG: EfeM/EfeO family lipoprotein [Solirubrobacterales bacterium]|nr:EfeM/EfeO family lipoprotein [Solirubrobacterales bacterium]
MPGSQSPQPATGAGPSRRYSRPLGWLAGIAGLALLALIAAAAIPGSSGDQPSRFGVDRVARGGSTGDQFPVRETKVFGSNINAKTYGAEIADQEDQGVGPNGQMASDLSPLPPSAFRGPIAAYRSYAEHWAEKLAQQLPQLRAALVAGDRSSAKLAWGVAYGDYLHLGAVYGLLPGTLDRQIDGMPSTLSGAAHNAGFQGLHRLELGLWTGASPRSLAPFAAVLARRVGTLRAVLPTVQITPLDYATRAHEILEDAQRDLISGMDVPWSGAGVLSTAAGLAATREMIGTLTPLLQGRGNALAEVQAWLAQLQAVIARLRAAHGGTWPSLGRLSAAQHELLIGTLAGALGALSQVPGTLETTPTPITPRIASESRK